MSQTIPVSEFSSSMTSSGVGGMGSNGIDTPSASDIDAFSRALQGLEQSAHAQSSMGVAAANDQGSAKIGDVVKSGLQAASDHIGGRMSVLEKQVKNIDAFSNAGDILKFTLESTKMGVELDFTGRVVSKAVQDVEQLTRQQ